MKPFSLIAQGIDTSQAVQEILDNAHLFGEFNARKESPESPHAEMEDIWVRYGDISEMAESGDYSTIANEHDSVWLKDLECVKRLCFDIMALVDGERLGGVLITKLAPDGMIYPHIDSGWHADYYDKYYIPIKNEDGAVFCFEEDDINPSDGDVWQFDNSHLHWVENKSKADRIAMIVCIKQSKYTRGGELCRGQQQQQ
jgi:hypothetical protein